MPVKVTFFFDFAKSGWSETHYLMTGNALDFTSATAAKGLALLRAGLLGGPVTVGGVNVGQPLLNWIRMSLDDVFRDSELVREPGGEQSALALGSTWPDPAVAYGTYRNDSLRVRGQAVNKAQRSIFYLAGLPKAVFTGDTTYSLSNPVGFLSAWNMFRTELISGRWGFRCLHNGAGIPVKKVTVEAAAPSRMQLNMSGPLTTLGPPPVPVAPKEGDQIQLRGFTAINKAYKPLNGKFYVAAYDATGGQGGLPLITLADTEGRDPTLIRKTGTAEWVDHQPAAYTDVFILGPSTRKRGLGLGSPSGRKRPVKEYAG